MTVRNNIPNSIIVFLTFVLGAPLTTKKLRLRRTNPDVPLYTYQKRVAHAHYYNASVDSPDTGVSPLKRLSLTSSIKNRLGKRKVPFYLNTYNIAPKFRQLRRPTDIGQPVNDSLANIEPPVQKRLRLHRPHQMVFEINNELASNNIVPTSNTVSHPAMHSVRGCLDPALAVQIRNLQLNYYQFAKPISIVEFQVPARMTRLTLNERFSLLP